jgi:hypothetical protein
VLALAIADLMDTIDTPFFFSGPAIFGNIDWTIGFFSIKYFRSWCPHEIHRRFGYVYLTS